MCIVLAAYPLLYPMRYQFKGNAQLNTQQNYHTSYNNARPTVCKDRPRLFILLFMNQFCYLMMADIGSRNVIGLIKNKIYKTYIVVLRK